MSASPVLLLRALLLALLVAVAAPVFAQASDPTPLQFNDAAEEARLALQGCAPLLDPGPGHCLHFDIGGGSTEIVWARLSADGETQQVAIRHQISIPCGVTALIALEGM